MRGDGLWGSHHCNEALTPGLLCKYDLPQEVTEDGDGVTEDGDEDDAADHNNENIELVSSVLLISKSLIFLKV